MTNSIYAEIKKRIEIAEVGTVFVTSDFWQMTDLWRWKDYEISRYF